MAKFEFNFPDGYEPIVPNLEYCIRPVRKHEYYLLYGEAAQWLHDEPTYESFLVLKEIEKPKTYKPFANDEEFESFADRWICRVNTETKEIRKGAFKIYGYDDDGVFLDHYTHRSYTYMFMNYTFKNGDTFGLERTND